MPLEPPKTFRTVYYPDGGNNPVVLRGFTSYEILDEFFEMWFQAWEAWDSVIKKSGATHGDIVFVVAEAKREVWEQAIMLYCGWNGAELNHWLGEKMLERGISR